MSQEESTFRGSLNSIWWGPNGDCEERIESLEGGLALVQKITLDQPGFPTMLEIWNEATGQAIAIGVGHSKTVLTYQDSEDPPYFISSGKSMEARGLVFCHGGQEIEYPSSCLVALEKGIEALDYFLRFRSRPPGIQWEMV